MRETTFTASQVLHRCLLAPSTAVGTTHHYLLDCMVIFCTPFTFHFFRPSSLLDVCSPCVDELLKAHSFISCNCHPGHSMCPLHDRILGLKGILSIHLLRPPDSMSLLLKRQPRSLPSSLLCLLDTWHPSVLGSSCQHDWTTQRL